MLMLMANLFLQSLCFLRLPSMGSTVANTFHIQMSTLSWRCLVCILFYLAGSQFAYSYSAYKRIFVFFGFGAKQVCQKLGLTGVDLFSPPDVVEKKEIRRVCSCIRALSKKARARHLEVSWIVCRRLRGRHPTFWHWTLFLCYFAQVPEFDYVTHTSVSMPTEFVGGIRDSLRQASANNSPSNLTPDKVILRPWKYLILFLWAVWVLHNYGLPACKLCFIFDGPDTVVTANYSLQIFGLAFKPWAWHGVCVWKPPGFILCFLIEGISICLV